MWVVSFVVGCVCVMCLCGLLLVGLGNCNRLQRKLVVGSWVHVDVPWCPGAVLNAIFCWWWCCFVAQSMRVCAAVPVRMSVCWMCRAVCA